MEAAGRRCSLPGFLASSDGVYRYYYNGGMYSEPRKSHEESNYRLVAVAVYDADLGKSRDVAVLPESNAQILGGSPDGEWIYIATMSDLK